MNRKLDQRFLPLILASLLALGIPACVCQNDNQYQTCTQNFRCGRLNRIGYPFWGGNRPVACGYPGFNLTCRDNEDPLLNISSVIYRVLEIIPSSQTLRVSRNDLLGNLCSTPSFNSTLDFNLFNYYPPASDQNITVYYGCMLPDPRPPVWPTSYQLSCNPSNENGVSLFAAPSMFQQVNGLGITCNSNIFVPVNQTSIRDLEIPAIASEGRLRGSLESGFSIQYLAENQNCRDCEGRDGLCGYNQTSTSFGCWLPANGTYE